MSDNIETRHPDDESDMQTDHQGIPLWVIVMWIFGIAAVIAYIVFGMQSTPTDWA